jgi:hypothetical protein
MDSDVSSNDLLRTVIYPDDTLVHPIAFTMHYNRLGAIKSKQDQMGAIHTLEYDKLSRLLHDRVTTLGATVDGVVRQIRCTYEVRGMVQNASTPAEAGQCVVLFFQLSVASVRPVRNSPTENSARSDGVTRFMDNFIKHSA